MIIMKFGGTSLAGRAELFAAAHRIAREVAAGKQVVAVVSAQGHTTDALVARALEIAPAPSGRELDALLATGEQASAALMAMALEAVGVPAVSLTGWQAGLHTDANFGDALVRHLDGRRIRQALEAGQTVVAAGFQGRTDAGDITTLGRGGSDTTAVALAACLGAEECRIYTDVDGVYDRDPRRFPHAVRYETVGYDTMLAMARDGAQVLHDRCVELARQHRIPIRVLSSFRPGPGTLVTDEE